MTPEISVKPWNCAACAAQNGSAPSPRPGGSPLPYALRRQAARQVLTSTAPPCGPGRCLPSPA
ncbi:MAG: hypothetical protein ACLRWQ_03660 [Flavonifractor plautii]